VNQNNQKLRVQQWVVLTAIILFIIKIAAYYLTQSVAILTDTLESTVNVIAGFIGLYSLYVAAKPRDDDHPYGHGKAEFLSAAVEGALISMAGLIIIYQAAIGFIHPHVLRRLDTGILLVAFTGLVNFIVGFFTIRKGKKSNSLALVASGKHLVSDTYSTIGIVIGLLLIYFTRLSWIDNVVAIVFALVVIYTGYHILRTSVAGIMDEADKKLLGGLVNYLNHHRRDNWVDLHNLRVIKYGSVLHIDCHLTVPWYLTVQEAHEEVSAMIELIKKEYGDTVEMFVHTDPCLDVSCSICSKPGCGVRRTPYEHTIEWTLQNVITDRKHSLVNK
jgi:cation diffusion facilitator family transporter